MGITPKPDKDIQQVLEALNRRVTNLEQANPLQGGVVISGGGLTAIDPNSGTEVFLEGIIPFNDGSGRKQMALLLRRNDGSLAMSLADLGTVNGHTFAQSFDIWDIAQNIIFADDVGSGQGLARPYIPIGFFTDNTVPTSTTTSGSFATLQTLVGYKQHPKVAGQILVYADVGTTGTIQLIDQSSNVLFTTNLTSGQFGYVSFGPVALAGTHEQAISLNIQGKVTGGAGKVGARGVSAIGVQT